MSNRMDTDMMDTDYTAAPPPRPSSIPDQNDSVRGLLSMARQLIDQGRPSQALQAVVLAMRSRGGEAAVFHTLNRAQELYRNKIESTAAADELATLFAECAIVEAMPSNAESSERRTAGPPVVEHGVHRSSILAETGRKQIVLDAFEDGSSFVCLQCGGLVSNQRKEEHYTFWCCKI